MHRWGLTARRGSRVCSAACDGDNDDDDEDEDDDEDGDAGEDDANFQRRRRGATVLKVKACTSCQYLKNSTGQVRQWLSNCALQSASELL